MNTYERFGTDVLDSAPPRLLRHQLREYILEDIPSILDSVPSM